MLLRLVTVTAEEDQINTPTCSPGAFIRHTNEPSGDKERTLVDKVNTVLNALIASLLGQEAKQCI